MNYIGLASKESKELAKELNILLSSFQLHYQNLRGLHWNIKGDKFFELHLKYEELYDRSQIIIDEIAERILTLGGTPFHTFSDYLKHSSIKEVKQISDGKSGMKYVLEAQQTLLSLERKILKLTDSAEDEGTNSLISDLIAEKEKQSWMFRSWLAA